MPDTTSDSALEPAMTSKKKSGGLEALLALGAADYYMIEKAQNPTLDYFEWAKRREEDARYLDLQDDHIAALRVIMDGMIRRNLSTTQKRKNISVFFSRVECFYKHYCLALNDVSLDDDLEKFKF